MNALRSYGFGKRTVRQAVEDLNLAFDWLPKKMKQCIVCSTI